MSQKRFCVMTVGRAGSTWLIQALGALPGVAVPGKNVPSPDNELVHRETQPHYERLAGKKFQDTAALIEFFFQLNAAAPFAGFKSMPRRHPDYRVFIQRKDIQFITLDRKDVLATAASFLNAAKHQTWRRSGGVPTQRLRLEPGDRAMVASNLSYILASRLALLEIADPIRLYYEDLCTAGFQSAPLDAYFEQPVVLGAPQAPTRASDYLENWDEFCDFVKGTWQTLTRGLSPKQKSDLGSVS